MIKFNKLAAVTAAAALMTAPMNVFAEDRQDALDFIGEYSDVEIARPVFEHFNSNDINGGILIRLDGGASAHVEITFDSPEGVAEPYYITDLETGIVGGFFIEGRNNEIDDYRYYNITITATDENGVVSAPYTGTFTVPDPNDDPDSAVVYAYVLSLTEDESAEKIEILDNMSFDMDDGGTFVGYKIQFRVGGYKLGDVNNDGLIDSIDAAMVLAENAALTSGESTFTDAQRNSADVNGDGLIDSVDASLILSYNAYIADGGSDDLTSWLNP